MQPKQLRHNLHTEGPGKKRKGPAGPFLDAAIGSYLKNPS